LGKPGPSVVLSGWVGSEKLRTNRGLVIGDSVTRAGQIDDDVAASHIEINICNPRMKRIISQNVLRVALQQRHSSPLIAEG
jgi:hypothetical protein